MRTTVFEMFSYLCNRFKNLCASVKQILPQKISKIKTLLSSVYSVWLSFVCFLVMNGLENIFIDSLQFYNLSFSFCSVFND